MQLFFLKNPIVLMLLFIIMVCCLFPLVESFIGLSFSHALSSVEKERLKEVAYALYERANNNIESKGVIELLKIKKEPEKLIKRVESTLALLKENEVGSTEKREKLEMMLFNVLGEDTPDVNNRSDTESLEYDRGYDNNKTQSESISNADEDIKIEGDLKETETFAAMESIGTVSSMLYDKINSGGSEFEIPGMKAHINENINDVELRDSLKIILEKISGMDNSEYNELINKLISQTK